MKGQVDKTGIEPLGHVAERVGEIVKEGVGELIDETKDKAIGSLPDTPEPASGGELAPPPADSDQPGSA